MSDLCSNFFLSNFWYLFVIGFGSGLLFIVFGMMGMLVLVLFYLMLV